jgi:hypothetical protein
MMLDSITTANKASGIALISFLDPMVIIWTLLEGAIFILQMLTGMKDASLV